MDKIHVNKIEFYGYHGVLPEETRLGQRFIVDLMVETDLKEAGLSDDIEQSISYVDLYQVCKEIVEGTPYKLIEAVAEKISDQILERFSKVLSVTVKVIKPNPPIPGHYESVAVEIKRSRL
ncbi:dihydroneopterin aldolase [Bacillus sp. V3B]|uniref:dihydroneopterin aldolase n=1 Tax=Bacillus sp. V3B TaxID=2804915 RepID=UPI00210AB600|nr:dihydroneopterin aldolase [Bacillus sp. V3B]MCQ6276741.1 dihydroneopterin aldolase [Bacillus sp. V3B]